MVCKEGFPSFPSFPSPLSSVKKSQADILRAAVGQHGDDDAMIQFARDLQCTCDSRASTETDEQPVLARQLAGHLPGILGVNRQVAVGQPWIVDARHQLGRQVLQPLDDLHLVGRLQGHQLDRRIVLLQPSSHTGERAGGTQSGDEMRYPATGLLQYL